MSRKTAMTTCLAIGAVGCLAWVNGAAGTLQQVGPGEFKPVASIGSLMVGQAQFFKGINRKLGQPPHKDRNHDIGEFAQVLAELANVNRYNKTDEQYVQFATDLRDLALDLSKEAKKDQAADNAKMRKLVEQMKSKCGACHDVYQ